MLEPITFSKKENILDMCCGTGGATYFISKRAYAGSSIMGMDLSKGQLMHAKRRKYLCDVSFIEGDVSNTGLESKSFDKVLIPHAMHEMNRELRRKTFLESFRLLKNNGQLAVLEVDNPPNIFMRSFIFIWFFYWLPFNFETPTRRDMIRSGVENEMRDAGFTNIRKHSIYNGVFQTVIGEKTL